MMIPETLSTISGIIDKVAPGEADLFGIIQDQLFSSGKSVVNKEKTVNRRLR